jgi:hypothetical protein
MRKREKSQKFHQTLYFFTASMKCCFVPPLLFQLKRKNPETQRELQFSLPSRGSNARSSTTKTNRPLVPSSSQLQSPSSSQRCATAVVDSQPVGWGEAASHTAPSLLQVFYFQAMGYGMELYCCYVLSVFATAMILSYEQVKICLFYYIDYGLCGLLNFATKLSYLFVEYRF